MKNHSIIQLRYDSVCHWHPCKGSYFNGDLPCTGTVLKQPGIQSGSGEEIIGQVKILPHRVTLLR